MTTSYVSDAIRELDGAAKEAGIVVLNEVGADPGVDHLYAIKKIEEVRSIGGKVSSFEPVMTICMMHDLTSSCERSRSRNSFLTAEVWQLVSASRLIAGNQRLIGCGHYSRTCE